MPRENYAMQCTFKQRLAVASENHQDSTIDTFNTKDRDEIQRYHGNSVDLDDRVNTCVCSLFLTMGIKLPVAISAVDIPNITN